MKARKDTIIFLIEAPQNSDPKTYKKHVMG